MLLLFAAWTEISARFLQEVELKDGTILVGYVYRQQPGKFIVFHANHPRKDPRLKYSHRNKDYTLQWKDVRFIRRSGESDTPWCNDRLTLKDGTVYIGQVEEQEIGVSLTLRCNDTGGLVTVKSCDLRISEKVVINIDKDLWLDRQYTNRLKLTDQSFREGLIVLQYRGARTVDSYVELLHGSGYRERIFLPDIMEYIILLQ